MAGRLTMKELKALRKCGFRNTAKEQQIYSRRKLSLVCVVLTRDPGVVVLSVDVHLLLSQGHDLK